MFIFSRFQIFRSIATFFTKPYSVEKYQEDSIFDDLDVKDAVASLRENGYHLGIKLPESISKEIFTFANHEKCFANADLKLVFNLSEKDEAQAKNGKNFIIADYLDTAERCPAINKIENDPKLLEIAATYLKSKPIPTNTRLWWSFVGDVTLDERLNFAQELFHYDPLDYSSLKFFFYITDVDLSSGPHVCVRGSHNNKKLSHQLTLFIGRSDREIIDYYKLENIVNICGEAGFGFAEDPYCFHKGTPPTQKNRLMLQVEFCRNDYRPKETK